MRFLLRCRGEWETGKRLGEQEKGEGEGVKERKTEPREAFPVLYLFIAGGRGAG
jgi:hypothetical protein